MSTRGERWIVAFSGGVDSTALAALLAEIAPRFEIELALVHVDHALDRGSTARARRAREIAEHLELPFLVVRADVPAERRRDESPEAAARRVRYRELERVRAELRATRILTAHQRDDQIETILLALLRGAPIERLRGIPASRGALWRPLLEFPRSALCELLDALAIDAIDDPTNLDLSVPRNRLRHELVDRLRADDPDVEEALLGLEASSARLASLLSERWRRRFRSRGESDGVAAGAPEPLPAALVTELPEVLQIDALRWLIESGGVRPPSRAAMGAFLRSLGSARPAALALEGGRWRLVARRGELRWAPRESRTPPFAYTFSIPGEVELPELGLRLRIGRKPVEPWMLRGDRHRAGFASEARVVTVRSRRPGDRMRPLGAPGHRKLKSILIDRGVPEEQRGRIPLLFADGELAWVPGVAIGDRFALSAAGDCWLAELETLPGRSGMHEPTERTKS